MNETLTLHNDIGEVPKLGEWIEQKGEELSMPMSDIFQINLALEEAVVNVMNYAYPEQEGMPVRLNMQGDNTRLIFTLEDDGIPFNPTADAKSPDITLSAEERPIGGLGIFLVKKIMSNVRYERLDNHNILTMTYERK